MVKIAVVLAGCGVKDGSEIHEAVLGVAAIDKLGAQAVFFAPDNAQADVVDHVSGRVTGERRNILIEAARIARGAIKPLREARVNDFDAVILPGGYGAAKNLCTWARDEARCRVDPELEKFLKEMNAAAKPIGAACIAPVILARVFGNLNPTITIGSDAKTAQAIEAMGARHQNASATEVVVDRKNKIATTPCYMLATRIGQIAEGMEGLVKAVLEMA
ncbi:MAG: isoprenoid biosynthesis glyoxalase ElbB [Elusimicrobia bacterium]|nr:isoprenoid biosynthesis glyoxalase ElbB [Elusimicrobiota bacterium]